MTPEWLAELETTVRRAVAEMERLRSENERLAAALEQVGAGGGDEEQARTWQAERQEIRARVERLVERLQGLLEG